MKKFVALVLTLVIGLSIAACESKEKETTTEETTTKVEETTTLEETTTTEEVVETTVDDTQSIMTFREYADAEIDSLVVIDACVQAKQSWWDNTATVYLMDEEGAYFVYGMACTEEEYELLVPGQEIIVTGYKSVWSGEIEITDATFVMGEANFIAEPLDITNNLADVDLIIHQNEFVSFTRMEIMPSTDAEGNEKAFLYNWDGSGESGSDLYFKASYNGETYTFTVESYLCGPDTDVYAAVEGLSVGDIVDMEGFLYWYEGVNPHITNVTVSAFTD